MTWLVVAAVVYLAVLILGLSLAKASAISDEAARMWESEGIDLRNRSLEWWKEPDK